MGGSAGRPAGVELLWGTFDRGRPGVLRRDRRQLRGRRRDNREDTVALEHGPGMASLADDIPGERPSARGDRGRRQRSVVRAAGAMIVQGLWAFPALLAFGVGVCGK